MANALYSGHHQLDNTFIMFLERADLGAKELNRLSMEKIIDYVRDFCEEPRVGRIEYIDYVVKECSKRGYLENKCERVVKSALKTVFSGIDRGYLDPDLAAEILKAEILNSKELPAYALWNGWRKTRNQRSASTPPTTYSPMR